ncbi:MAG TPA: alpha/beta hydrolase [Kofleriaceae bacterium]|nr:alpha/beta hydrolase [Kofleriaceae bacterium]
MTPVLLIHSSGFTSRQWRRLADLLAPRYRVIAPDLLGYGAARWPVGEPFHFRQDVALLAGLLDEPAHIVGHSYGGLLALQLALARPELVRRIAVYEPVIFGFLDEPEDAAARAAVDQLGTYRPDAAGLDEPWLERFADWWQGPGAWRALPAPTRQAFCDVGWKLSQEVASLLADRTDRARYATITAPTLILAGERTQPAELHVVQKLARTLPGAKLELFPELGHMGPITGGAAVNAAIAAFLEA